MTDRRGVSLVELLVAIVVAAIIGASLISLLIGQSKFSERLTAERDARSAARGAQAILSADLRMVDPDWGIESASSSVLQLRVPYALGVFCGTSGGSYVVQLLPVDPTQLVEPGHAGFAVRGKDGVYLPYLVSGLSLSGGTATCTGATPAIAMIPGATIVTVPPPGAATPPVPGTPVMMFRRIEYRYGTSAVTGQRALFRTVLGTGSNAVVEIGGPFLGTATFSFISRANPERAMKLLPSPLTDLIGIEVGMPGRPERNPRMAEGLVSTDLTTSIYFTNRRN